MRELCGAAQMNQQVFTNLGFCELGLLDVSQGEQGGGTHFGLRVTLCDRQCGDGSTVADLAEDFGGMFAGLPLLMGEGLQ